MLIDVVISVATSDEAMKLFNVLNQHGFLPAQAQTASLPASNMAQSAQPTNGGPPPAPMDANPNTQYGAPAYGQPNGLALQTDLYANAAVHIPQSQQPQQAYNQPQPAQAVQPQVSIKEVIDAFMQAMQAGVPVEVPGGDVNVVSIANIMRRLRHVNHGAAAQGIAPVNAPQINPDDYGLAVQLFNDARMAMAQKR